MNFGRWKLNHSPYELDLNQITISLNILSRRSCEIFESVIFCDLSAVVILNKLRNNEYVKKFIDSISYAK